MEEISPSLQMSLGESFQIKESTKEKFSEVQMLKENLGFQAGTMAVSGDLIQEIDLEQEGGVIGNQSDSESPLSECYKAGYVPQPPKTKIDEQLILAPTPTVQESTISGENDRESQSSEDNFLDDWFTDSSKGQTHIEPAEPTDYILETYFPPPSNEVLELNEQNLNIPLISVEEAVDNQPTFQEFGSVPMDCLGTEFRSISGLTVSDATRMIPEKESIDTLTLGQEALYDMTEGIPSYLRSVISSFFLRE